jgi:hypothetical protein
LVSQLLLPQGCLHQTQCLAFWCTRFACHCIRIYVLIYTLSRLIGSWLYLYYLYHFLCLGLLLTKWNFPVSHTQTLCGTLSLWKNKANTQPPLHKNVKASGQIDNETLWKSVM